MKIRSAIIAIATLAVLVGVITTLALSSFTAEAQSTRGAIANLQLTSTTAGTLTVSWDAASPTPTDYRVDWAKSSEDYKSWKVDDGHKYPDPSATTATITDLGHDTEYKIRMRARYYRGEHEGKSWGGPWETATITVAGEPAETPTPEPVKEEPVQQPPRDAPDPPAGTIETLTAADETGQLLLTWDSAKRRPHGLPHQLGQEHRGLPGRTPDRRQRPSNRHHPYVGRPRLRHRLQRQGQSALHRRRERRQPVERTLDRDDRPGHSCRCPSPKHHNSRRQSRASQVLSVMVGTLRTIPSLATRSCAAQTPRTWSSSKTTPGRVRPATPMTAPPAGQTHTYGVKARNSAGLSPAGTAHRDRARSRKFSSSQGMKTAETPWFQT